LINIENVGEIKLAVFFVRKHHFVGLLRSSEKLEKLRLLKRRLYFMLNFLIEKWLAFDIYCCCKDIHGYWLRHLTYSMFSDKIK
jgi:hypothetical protein